jgi:hypothetical protein
LNKKEKKNFDDNKQNYDSNEGLPHNIIGVNQGAVDAMPIRY